MLHLIQVDVNRSKLVKTLVVSSITSLNCYLKDLDKLPAFMARLYYVNNYVYIIKSCIYGKTLLYKHNCSLF